jgi:hypothetical protein
MVMAKCAASRPCLLNFGAISTRLLSKCPVFHRVLPLLHMGAPPQALGGVLHQAASGASSFGITPRMKKFLPRIFIGSGRIPSFTYRSMVLRLLSNRFATLVLDSSAAPGSYRAMLVLVPSS